MTFLKPVLTLSIPGMLVFILAFVMRCFLSYRKSMPAFSLPVLYAVCLGSLLLTVSTNISNDDLVSVWKSLNFFILPEFLICVYYLRKHVTQDMASRLLLFIHQFFPLGLIYVCFYLGDLAQVNATLIGVHHLLISVSCLLYFHQQSIQSPEQLPLTYASFWNITGIMVSSGVSLTTGVLFINGVTGHFFTMGVVLYICARLVMFVFFSVALTIHLRSI